MKPLRDKKYLIFIRHAQQDRATRQPDCGLTKTGQKQAQDAAQFIVNRWVDQWVNQLADGAPQPSLEIHSSPKRRCLETMEALKNITQSTIQVDPLLHEAFAHESFEQFYQRIHAFLEKWKASDSVITIACTHSDWIPVAVRSLTMVDFEVRHTGLIEICQTLNDFEITLKRQPEI